MSEIKDAKKSTYLTELNKRKKDYKDPEFKKVVVAAEIVMWLESEKISVDYAKECAEFLINAGKVRRVDFTQTDGREVLDHIKYGEVKTYKYD
jgi:methyl coenzyme M reductase subunit D